MVFSFVSQSMLHPCAKCAHTDTLTYSLTHSTHSVVALSFLTATVFMLSQHNVFCLVPLSLCMGVLFAC